MDNHDDSHCFGVNFRPISFTLEEYTVSPFIPEYTEQVKVPFFTGVNVLKLDSREVLMI